MTKEEIDKILSDRRLELELKGYGQDIIPLVLNDFEEKKDDPSLLKKYKN